MGIEIKLETIHILSLPLETSLGPVYTRFSNRFRGRCGCSLD